MKPQELIKKFWFVGVLAICALIFVGAYSIDAYKNRDIQVPTKQVDGKYVIYSINGENYYADELYEDLSNSNGLQRVFQTLQHLVIDKAVETTSEMQTLATNNASYLLSIYDQATLDSDLKSLGYAGVDELDEYYLYIIKNQKFSKDYFLAHEDEYVTPFMEKESPRMISHILIKVADVQKNTNEDGTYTLVANPTEEETAKLNAALEALKTESFATVAVNYSEDGSAQSGGALGISLNSTIDQYVKEFKEAALALDDGEVSDVVLSEFGYHIIRCDANTPETLLEYPEFIDLLLNETPELYVEMTLEKAAELNIEVTDEAFKAEILASLEESEEAE